MYIDKRYIYYEYSHPNKNLLFILLGVGIILIILGLIAVKKRRSWKLKNQRPAQVNQQYYENSRYTYSQNGQGIYTSDHQYSHNGQTGNFTESANYYTGNVNPTNYTSNTFETRQSFHNNTHNNNNIDGDGDGRFDEPIAGSSEPTDFSAPPPAYTESTKTKGLRGMFTS
ncbi:hypothetical protein CLIB1444_04S02014 [[Candida] jaroonii]|uniref:Uncharacterized protein n=1 Tax=[Candida] jaroonii TaxID=467808 RepID=A0ACA9Y737_9ASCO|nr:hypothetical protein CLIB1444_04S02014 [[Candida] jaroonii]